MFRFLLKLIICLGLAIAAGLFLLAFRSGDVIYTAYEWISERGLMQVSERAAREWARENQVANFHADDLLDAKTNLEAGAWYLHRAFQHWEHQKKPAVFALAEYNAGASRAQRWANNDSTAPMSERAFRSNIDFPGTRNYVASVLERCEFYRKRGRM